VSVHPSGSPSLSQSLPSAILSALPNNPAPVMTSAPSWGASAAPTTPVVPAPSVTANYLQQATAACAPDSGTGSPVRPHYNVFAPKWGGNPVGCGSVGCGGSLRDRLKEWLHYQPEPGDAPRMAPTTYRANNRAYFPYRTGDCGTEACASGGGALAGAVVRPDSAGQACDASIPVTPLQPGSSDCAPQLPRVRYMPLSPRAEMAPSCTPNGAVVRDRPSLLKRLLGLFGRDRGQCGVGGCAEATFAPGAAFGVGGNCPPPAPSPVHYAGRGQPSSVKLHYAAPCTTTTHTAPGCAPTPPVLPQPVAAPGAIPATPNQPFTNQ
jgi:hypothetical protein